MAEADDADIAKNFAELLGGEEAGAVPQSGGMQAVNSDNSAMDEVVESDDSDDEEQVQKKTPKMPSFGGDNFLKGLSVKPAQATSMQQEARLASVQAQAYIDLWAAAPYPALKYDKTSFNLMITKREKYLRKVAVQYGPTKSDLTVSRETAVPTGGTCLEVNAVNNKPLDLKEGGKWTRIAQRVARDKGSDPQNKLKAGASGYIPQNLLFPADKKPK